MIRTRDFALYAVIVLFLLTGIVATVLGDFRTKKTDTVVEVKLIAGQDIGGVAVPREDGNQAATIARLKQKLADGEGEVISAPPDLTSVDETPQVKAATSTSREVLQCGNIGSGESELASWPGRGLELQTLQGSRNVVYSYTYQEQMGSSTIETATSTVILSLPINSARNPFDSCINISVVGVTATGVLLTNSEAIQYRGFNQYALVGYAFDGFPIYGPLPDSSVLDSCGGYQTPAGYQYHIRTDESFMIGCFAGTPANLNL